MPDLTPPQLAVEFDGVPVRRDIPLPDSGLLTLGREGNIRLLGDPAVSRRHISLHRDSGALLAEDHSGGRSRINDTTFTTQELVLGDVLQVRGFHLEYRGTFLRWTDGEGARIEATGLVREVPDRRNVGRTIRILDGAELLADGGEFVGLLGPSGAGKTTLLKAISGLCPANAGTIEIDGRDLRTEAASLSSVIGFVPQDDIVHSELTVEQALMFSARLRLPGGIPDSEIEKLIHRICAQLKLTEHLKKRIRESSGGGLSGGQRKRVSVAVELLSSPRVLFLDEPTSGLDPATEAQLMAIFRRLANRGCTIVCTTHVVENAYLMDSLCVVVNGSTVFQGDERAAKSHFGVKQLTAMYVGLEEQALEDRKQKQTAGNDTPEATRKANPLALRVTNFANRVRAAFSENLPMLVSQTKQRAASIPLSVEGIKSGSSAVFGGFLKRVPSTRVLLERRLAILNAEWKNILLLVLQPLIIGLAVAFFVPVVEIKLFFVHLSILWLGSNNAAQEIVKEIGIYRRERFVGLSIASYLASKFVFGTAVTLLQAAVIYGCVLSFDEGIGVDTSVPLVLASIVFTTLSANAIGLVISSCSKTPEIALFVVPLFLIPQILFSGGVVTLDQWKDREGVKALAEWMPAYSSQRIMDVARLYGNELSYDANHPLGLSAEQQIRADWPVSYPNLRDDYDLYPPDVDLDTLAPAIVASSKLTLFTVVGLGICWFALRVRERE